MIDAKLVLYRMQLLLLDLSDYLEESKYFNCIYNGNELVICDLDNTRLISFYLTTSTEDEKLSLYYYTFKVEKDVLASMTYDYFIESYNSIISNLRIFSYMLSECATCNIYTKDSKTHYSLLHEEFSLILKNLENNKTIYD